MRLINGAWAWSRRRLHLIVIIGATIAILSWFLTSTFAAIDDRNTARREADIRNELLARQAMVLERDLTALRIRAEQTADCPVLYLRDLLAESAKPLDQQDLGAVGIPPHCRPRDLRELEARLHEIEAQLALLEIHTRGAGGPAYQQFLEGLRD